jgi:hypothetical protein
VFHGGNAHFRLIPLKTFSLGISAQTCTDGSHISILFEFDILCYFIALQKFQCQKVSASSLPEDPLLTRSYRKDSSTAEPDIQLGINNFDAQQNDAPFNEARVVNQRRSVARKSSLAG